MSEVGVKSSRLAVVPNGAADGSVMFETCPLQMQLKHLPLRRPLYTHIRTSAAENYMCQTLFPVTADASQHCHRVFVDLADDGQRSLSPVLSSHPYV